jgi:hypothetical protein
MRDGNNPYRSPDAEPRKANWSRGLNGMHKGYLVGAVLAVVASVAGIKKNLEMIQGQHLEPGFSIGLFVAPTLILLLGAFLLYKAISYRP